MIKANFILAKLIEKITEKFAVFGDNRLDKTIKVKNSLGNVLFTLYDFGRLCRFRARTFFVKEPETLEWISTFSRSSFFIDIGANIGIYSLYAARQGVNVVSVEPDSLNFALLNLNIFNNSLSKSIRCFPIALHDNVGYSALSLKKLQWGGALSCFDDTRDQFGTEFQPEHIQGVYGDTLDNFVESIGQYPSHVKIDVDGNELYILKGGSKVLSSKHLKSMLIELDENHPHYTEAVQLCFSYGFELSEKSRSKIYDKSRFKSTYNHIFTK